MRKIFLLNFFFLNLICSPNVLPSSILEISPKIITPGKKFRVIFRRDDLKGKNLSIHYGYNGWKLEGRFPFSMKEDPSLNYYNRTPMDWDPLKDGHVVDLIAPPKAKSFHFVFCWDQCTKWDNNNRQDYSWPIEFPYLGPILTWNKLTSPDRGVIISFENSFASPANLYIWPKGKRDLEKFFSGPPEKMHKFQLTELLPDTEYQYQLEIPEFQFSPVYSFKTAPSPENLQSFSFIVLGDVQDDGVTGELQIVSEEIVNRHQEVNFVISMGDLPLNDHPGYWWILFHKAKKLFSRWVFMPVAGNHDTPSSSHHKVAKSFRRYFSLPYSSSKNLYYDFRFGSTKFFALNSERPLEFKKDKGTQYKWLRQKLKVRKEAIEHLDRSSPWTFTYWHSPPFNVGTTHWGEQFKYQEILPLFKGVVDWHFSGHEHIYQRSIPLIFNGKFKPSGQYGTNKHQGVGYLVVPSAGIMPTGTFLAPDHRYAKYRTYLSYPKLSENGPSGESVQSKIGFVKVIIQGNQMTLQTYGKTFGIEAGNLSKFEVIDQVSYSKQSHDND